MRNLIALLILISVSSAFAATTAKPKPKTQAAATAKPLIGPERAPAQATFTPADDDEEDDASGPQENDDPTLPPKPEATIQSDTTPPPTDYAEPSAGSTDDGSTKLYDWRDYNGEREIEHPLASKGLIRITKDKTYIYKTDESEQKRAASFRVGLLSLDNLENPEEAGNVGATFEENYDTSSGPVLLVDYEWQLWNSGIGKFGVKAGSGIFVAQGHGHFVNRGDGLQPRENFTFMAFPNSVGAVYRAQIWDRQLFVPYAEGGGIAWTFGEFRDDNTGPKAGGALGAYAAGGIGMNLTYFDAFSRIQLDREYGINAVFLTVEFRTIVALSDKYDFSSDVFNGGFLMEF